MYVPLRNHGWHSLLTAIDPPELLLARAEQLGLPALALTDVDTLSGSTSFLQAPRGSARPILGAEISDPTGRPGRLVALVRNRQGYANLCKLVSARQLGDDPGSPGAELSGPARFRLAEAAGRFQEGLTFLADRPELLFELAPRVDTEHLHVAISPASLGKRAARSGGAVPTVQSSHIALDPHKLPAPSHAPPASELIACARALGLATLAVPDVYWTRDDGLEHHRMRTAIKHNALACDLPARWLAELPAQLPSGAAMQELYRDLPDVPGRLQRGQARHAGALLRTLEVAERCRFLPELGGVIFPEAELPDGETSYSQLCCLAFEGARKRFSPLRPEVIRRLDYELAAIEDLGFAPYFLLVHKIAGFAREQKIPYVGRGSAADSLVAYCLELTDADPLRYKLPFERFLNPGRSDRPDIDLDFSWRRRDEVLEHVWQAFGAERTAMISTLNRFGLRAAFREASLASGIPPVEVNRWSKRLPWMTPRTAGAPHDGSESTASQDPEEAESDFRIKRAAPPDKTAGLGEQRQAPSEPPNVSSPLPSALLHNPIAQAFHTTPECRDFPFDDARYAFILRMAEGLLDTPRHLGLHPGGVVVAPGPITDIVSCQRAAKGVLMTQLDKHGVEALGLVKMDLLGNRALTVIEDCLDSIERSTGQRLDLRAIPEQEPRTQAILAAGKTLGCFQVESPGMRNLLQQTAARNMDDVIQAVALIRPGPSGSGMKDAYIRRFRGLEKPVAPHPRLTEMLAETHGVMLYQEDVMQAVVLLAGMDLSGADELRRALAKRRPKELKRLRQRFFDGCQKEGLERADVSRVWELIANFSSFGFCKAHAVTYGQIAYRTVYLKAHYPAAYLTAFLNSETGYYEARVYVEEARRLGTTILPPDVNRSQLEFSLELPAHGPGSPPPKRPAMRVGLNRVKGLTETTKQTILRERQHNGAFLSLPDFLTRSGARTDETERLIQSGAFDAFDRTRPEMLWRLHLFASPTRRAPADLVRESGPLDQSLLAACHSTPDQRAGGWSRPSLGLGAMQLEPGHSTSLFPEPETPALALPALPDTDALTRGRLELELLGLTIHAHPTELFPCPGDDSPPRHHWIPCAELHAHKDERVLIRGWLAASRRVRTSDGRWMRFLTLEDKSGLCEVVLFADAYERLGHCLTSRGPYRIFGRVQAQMGSHTLHAEGIQ